MPVKYSRTKHKYNASKCELDGIRFDSKMEANYYLYLKKLQDDGEVIFFLRQTPFHLPGGVRYVCDFQIFFADGSIQFVDVKGYPTAEFKAKKKLVEAIYHPVEIKVVSKV